MGGDSHLEVVSMWVVVTGSVGEWMRGQDVVAREPSLGKQPPWRDGEKKRTPPWSQEGVVGVEGSLFRGSGQCPQSRREHIQRRMYG